MSQHKLFSRCLVFVAIMLLAHNFVISAPNIVRTVSAQQSNSNSTYLPVIAQPNPFRVTEQSLLSLRNGTLNFQGTVVQDSPQPLTNIQIRVNAFNRNGRFIGSVPAQTILPIVFPNQPMPFKAADMSSIPVQDTFSYIPEVINWSIATQTNIHTITVTEFTLLGERGSEIYYRIGLRNDTNTTLTNIQLILWSIPLVSNVFLEAVAGTLAPGEARTIETGRLFLETNNAKVIVQGQSTP